MDILTSQFLSVYYVIFLSVFLYMTFWFVLSAIKRRSDLADEAWGIGFILIAIVSGSFNNAKGAFLITFVLVTIWGLRLFYHIHKRHKKNGEDVRYKELTQNGTRGFLTNYVKIFLFQGFLMIIVASPVIVSAYFNKMFSELTWVNYLGFLIWTVGFYFETTADGQLKKFAQKHENAGKLMTIGLWKYSRHPNYFGEITMWWGLWILAHNPLDPGFWLAAAIGPILITFLISFVSGIPLLEKRYARRKDWQEYAKKTSVLIPWFIKKY